MTNDPVEDTVLSSGYRFIRWNSECWVQLPQSMRGVCIPDQYIFHPEWNRERVNAWWRTQPEARDAD